MGKIWITTHRPLSAHPPTNGWVDSYQKLRSTSRLYTRPTYQVSSKSVQPFWPKARRTELFFFVNLENLEKTVICKFFQIGELKFRFFCTKHVSPGDTSACQIWSESGLRYSFFEEITANIFGEKSFF